MGTTPIGGRGGTQCQPPAEPQAPTIRSSSGRI